MKISLDHLISVLDTLTPLAKAVPEPVGGPLEGALECANRILKYVKEVKLNKEEAKELAQDAVSWTELLTKTIEGLKLDAAGRAGLEEQVENFGQLLARIAIAMDQQTRQDWVQSFSNKSRDAAEMAQFRRDLRIGFEQFMAQSELRLQAGQQQLQGTVDFVSTHMEANSQGIRILLSVAERDTLNLLKPVGAARWDSRVSPTGCLSQTRIDVLQNLWDWYHNPSKGLSVYWLTGLAGTGKSTIAKSFCEQVSQTGSTYLITFFISKVAEERRDPQRILFTLVYDLAIACATVRPHIVESLRANPDVRDRSRQEQIQRLLVEPIAAAANVVAELNPLVIVLDALDESYGTHGVQGAILIHDLVTALKSVPAKLLVTSRTETILARTLTQLSEQIFRLHEIDQTDVGSDVKRILVHGFEEIVKEQSDLVETQPWPSQVEVDALVMRTGHLIVYATTVLKYVGDCRYPPEDRLKQVLHHHNASESGSAFRPVDLLYLDILRAAAQNREGDIDDDLCRMLRSLVGVLCIVKRPLTIASLTYLLNTTERRLRLDIGALSSVLLFSETEPGMSQAQIVRIFHQSFRDFVIDRCSDTRFLIDISDCHAVIALQCLKILNDCLQQDICGIQDYTLANAEVKNPDLGARLQSNVRDLVQYACMHWPAHVQSITTPTPALWSELDTFATIHLLHWIELLSLLDQLPHAIISLARFLVWFQQDTTKMGSSDREVKCDRLVRVERLLTQTLQTLQTYDPLLKTHALHIYHGVQLTMPECQLLHVDRIPIVSARLISSRADEWRMTHVVMRGHSDFVYSVSFSPDGTKIASGSEDHTVRIWDAQSGREVATLHGHGAPVRCVTFSPDGTQIASCSNNGAVRLWDPPSGHEITALQVARGVITSVAFAPDGTRIAVGCGDETIRVWHVQLSCEIAVLVGHSAPVYDVSFSPDGTKVASGDGSGTVRVWDSKTFRVMAVLSPADGIAQSSVHCVAFSPDHSVIAAGGLFVNGSVRIWSTQSDREIARLLEPLSVKSLAFSLDGTKIVSSTQNTTVQIWDAKTYREIAKLKGHSGSIYSVAFSPDCTRIVTGSLDNTVRLWDIRSYESYNIGKSVGHSGPVKCLAVSSDGTMVASGSDDRTVRIWDLHSGWEIQMLEGHEYSVSCVGFSSDGTQIASGDADKTVLVWDLSSGKQIAILEGHNNLVSCVAFSPDGTMIATGSWDRSLRIWTMPSGKQTSVFTGHTELVTSVAFSIDGTQLVSTEEYGEMFLWDIDSPDYYTVCSPESLGVSASASSEVTFFWEESTGWISCYSAQGISKSLCWLPEDLRGPRFATHGTTLVLGGRHGMITIIDLSNVQ